MLTKTKAAIVTTLFLSLGAQADTILNVATAGDQNMVDYVKTWLGPKFEAAHPGVKVRVIGTGPGDAGSNKISEKLTAQQESGAQQWDIDVAVVHQKAGGEQVEKGLLQKYRQDIQTGGMVSSPSATQALGVNVDGYVMPMFLSQTAIAWNSDLLSTPPASYDELVAWTQKHPQAFGYNGIKNGMSGVSFVVGWIYAYGTDAQRLSAGPYDKSVEKGWLQAYEKLKAFNKNVTFTPGNAGTLDMLSRGEIAMGPVWVDMFYSWKDQGKLPPSIKLALLAPGMPGQPMYYVIPAKAANPQLARDFIALATSPEVQAQGIVKQFNWYPGIDAGQVKPKLDTATWQKLFAEISPEALAKYGKSFPIAPYFDDIKEGYESQVAN
ncbi:ABC transporter substrate-binding protein [Klebsiella variicola]|uniref:ABC transporter substrate-binding protein n=1 Tax=Klebsiella variicola TaxID=244366 RepID=UPI00111F061F|nr:extracellular solute-binding protein [Klebsiella variicola]TPE10010.1 extracellular solute-binding protein [Klebsiella variicola]TPE23661.1 extracellular solute-binding protein [Klebsiella variicola]